MALDIFNQDVEEMEESFSFGGDQHVIKIRCVHDENHFIAKYVPQVVWPAAEVLAHSPARLSC